MSRSKKSRVYGLRRRGIGAAPVSHVDACKSLKFNIDAESISR